MPTAPANPLRFRNAWLAIGFLGVLLDVILSLAPAGSGSLPVSDKLIHFLIYLLLVFWFMQIMPARAAWLWMAFSLLGLALEFAQQQVPGREMDWLDAAANAIGAISGVLISFLSGHRLLLLVDRKLAERFA